VTDLIVCNVSVERDGRVILDGCSADFPASRRTVLWGRSGAGKSTLLAAIAGLLTPQAGTIELGTRVFFSRSAGIDLPPHERRVGLVFQDLALWARTSPTGATLGWGATAARDCPGAGRQAVSSAAR